MAGNVLEYLENAAAVWPDRVGFEDEKETLTYAALLDTARRIGTGVAAYAEPRQPVAVIMTDRSICCVAALLGVLYAGCPYAPLGVTMPAERIRAVFEQLQPAAILCDEATLSAAEAVSWDCPVMCYEQLVKTEIDAEKLARIREQDSVWDILSILFTSGSTGVPKGVAQSQYSYLTYTDITINKYSFTEKTIFGNQSPFFYANSIIDIYPPLKLGAKVYILPVQCLSFPKMLVDTLREQHITELTMTPSGYVKIAESGALTQGCLPELEYIILSGEAAHWQTLKTWMAAAPNGGVWNFYGSTEAFSVAVWRLDRAYSDGEVIPVGVPFPEVEVLIVDEDGEAVPRGEKGAMLISNPWMCSGYYRDAVRTEAAFVTDPLGRGYHTRYYRTGDMGMFNERGQLVVLGRQDGQIKRAGYRMELGEVEAALRVIPGWENGLVLYDKESGKLVCFWTGALTKKEIMAELKKTLPRYAQPDTYIHLDEMPYTSTMKIDRVKLKAMIK